jgi:hypothetical protein
MSVVSGPERVERRLVAFLELLIHVGLDLVHRHVAGALDHHLAAVAQAILVSSPSVSQLGELGSSLASAIEPGRRPSPRRTTRHRPA